MKLQRKLLQKPQLQANKILTSLVATARVSPTLFVPAEKIGSAFKKTLPCALSEIIVVVVIVIIIVEVLVVILVLGLVLVILVLVLILIILIAHNKNHLSFSYIQDIRYPVNILFSENQELFRQLYLIILK